MYPLKGKRKFISICKSWITLEISCKPILYAICFSLEICLFVKRIWIVKRKAVEDIVCKVRTQDPDEVVTRRKMSWVCHVQPLLWPLRSESFEFAGWLIMRNPTARHQDLKHLSFPLLIWSSHFQKKKFEKEPKVKD